MTATPFTLRIRALSDRLHLDDAQASEYLGVPVHTYRKWVNGTRQPGAAVHRLLDVLALLEAHAPTIHSTLLSTPNP
jgi:DNA-binding transcriptional regulator YiaG